MVTDFVTFRSRKMRLVLCVTEEQTWWNWEFHWIHKHTYTYTHTLILVSSMNHQMHLFFFFSQIYLRTKYPLVFYIKKNPTVSQQHWCTYYMRKREKEKKTAFAQIKFFICFCSLFCEFCIFSFRIVLERNKNQKLLIISSFTSLFWNICLLSLLGLFIFGFLFSYFVDFDCVPEFIDSTSKWLCVY